jgi:D-alanyl-D-alanine endopeptidase (penicillin-binding protein 7)
MSFSPRRFAVVSLILSIVLLVPAHAESATARKRSGSRVHATGKAKRTTHVARARRARRAPPGGVYARAAIVLDPLTGKVLYQKNADRSAPIASLTKLMTAMVFLDQRPDLERSVEVTREELFGGGQTQLRNGEKVALGDLLHMSLMCSDNVATRILARESGLEKYDFIARMNDKAKNLELTGARFVEFTGLDQGNVATASDVAVMLRAAAANDLIHSITTTTSYEFTSDRRAHIIGNTNRLLHSRYQILGGKTGFISQAGYCFATWIRTDGQDLIAVVLGAPTNATRFADVVRLVQKTTAPGFTAATVKS